MKAIYYFVRYDTFNPLEDLQKMASYIQSTSRYVNVVNFEDSSFQVTFEDDPKITATLKLPKSTQTLFSSHSGMMLEINKTDVRGLNIFRYLAERFKYKVFIVDRECFLPNNPNIYDSNNMIIDEKLTRVFKAKNLKPVFVWKNSRRFYAEASDGSIHIVNPYLLDYFTEFGLKNSETREFNYQVAENLTQFVALFDPGLIPDRFYEYYGKNLGLINFSGLDLWRVKRKIFISPFITEFNEKKREYEFYNTLDSGLHYMDKIRKGENIKTAFLRHLRETLHLDGRLVRLNVLEKIEFDRDKQDKLIPRVTVIGFFDRLKKTKKSERLRRRSWLNIKEANRYKE